MTDLLIITGASTGIGLATARRFSSDGFDIVNLSRRSCPLKGATSIPCDLSLPGFVDSIAPKLVPTLRAATRVVLVHCAALNVPGAATDTDESDLVASLQVNVIAPSALNRLVLPAMQASSSILYVGSTLSEKAVPGSFNYVTSKHAQIGMMRALCQDLIGREIHTACICPGFTDTEMLRTHVPQDQLASLTRQVTFGRLIEPDEIAETIFWASNNPVINGATIHANLGQIEH